MERQADDDLTHVVLVDKGANMLPAGVYTLQRTQWRCQKPRGIA
jgi:hypothetical protein